MPLHIDYRPKNFGEVIGNKETIKKLKTIFDRESKDYPHSILFTGPSGCGKTTLARIVKDLVGCIGSDFIEINASNARGIDTSREIIKQMQLSPMYGPSRVYLLDEVHQGTRDFQNSLLKALEDTPKHVFFILCTTDPQKLLTTIKNRCSIFQVEKLSERQLESLVVEVLDSEGIDDIPKSAVKKIAEISEGCPRQALVILDQVIDLDPEEIDDAIKNLSISENKQVIDLCRALAKRAAWSDVAKILKGLKEEPERVRQAVIGYVRTCILNNPEPDPIFALIFECFREPNFYNGQAGLAFACLEVIEG